MEDLFGQFKAVSAAQWKAQLEKDLKGLPYQDLIWHNENGFDIQPFYTAEDLHSTYEPAFYHTDWNMSMHPVDSSATQTNVNLLTALRGGANAICIDLKNCNLEATLKDIRLDFIHSTFIGSGSELTALGTYLSKHYKELSINYSVLPTQLHSAEDFQAFASALKLLPQAPENNAAADVLTFHNQNCGAALEVALLFSQLLDQSPEQKTIASVRLGLSADYFVQMAKLRAVRRLWEVLKTEFKSTSDLYIIAETGLTNKTISDRHNNLLRSTVEAMAGIAGGCNELIVQDFEALTGKSSALSQRMAINQQHILREESYFDKMGDVSCGSYFIESLTDAIAQKALEKIKSFEKQGGYYACLISGKISAEIDAAATLANKAFEEGKSISIGVNRFRNEKEQVQFDADYLKSLQSLGLNNPALNYEFTHFFTSKHA